MALTDDRVGGVTLISNSSYDTPVTAVTHVTPDDMISYGWTCTTLGLDEYPIETSVVRHMSDQGFRVY